MSTSVVELLSPARDYCNEVDKRISDILEEEKQGIIFDRKEELFTLSGKMLRPSLAYYAFTAALSSGGNNFAEVKLHPKYNEFLIFGSVVELIHNASLVHDDILDDEKMRRGEPTLQNKFGVSTALLAGNVLYMLAFRLCIKYLQREQSVAIVNTTELMCQSELTQLNSTGKIVDREIYLRIIAGKTGALAAASCGEAARIAGADARTIAIYNDIGMHIGILYQLLDDLSDKDTSGNVERYGELIYKESLLSLKKQIGLLADNAGRKGLSELLSFFESRFI